MEFTNDRLRKEGESERAKERETEEKGIAQVRECVCGMNGVRVRVRVEM